MDRDQAGAGDCSEAAQDAGDCLGWAGTRGADPVAAAIASALLQGRSAGARAFFENHRAEVDPATRDLILEAFAVESVHGAGAARRVLAPLVYPPPPTM
ncbi:hypothetical protein ABZX12_13310 [Kribbella sp. NPDC003505]|uniref:hypothetical protein n=1 Tax=Kribbella sp. NPDC003505 TaxID=3154448 RepID=UPI0033B062C8